MPVVLPLISLPLLASPAIYVIGRTLPYHSVARTTSLLLLTGAWVLFGLLTLDVQTTGPVVIGTITLQADGLSILMIFLALLLGTAAVIFSGPDMAAATHVEKYYAILFVTIGAIIGLVCTTDLFNLWVWFELMAVSSYTLVAFYSERNTPLEAAIKYLVQTAVGSGLVLFAIALILAQNGTLALDGLHTDTPLLTVIACSLLLIGFGVKIAIFPMYTWLPDAYAAAPTGVTALLSGAVSVAGLVALMRALTALSDLPATLSTLLIIFGLLNIFAGNILALSQQQIKRMLAYSSVGHTGYILLALGIGLHSGQSAGIQAGLLHVLNHGIMKVLAFLAVGALIFVLQKDHQLTINELGGMGWRYPLIGVALSLALLSLAGIPPLAGFMSKWQIFAAGLATEQPGIVAAITFAALNSVFSLAYYLPVINALYRQEHLPTDINPPLAMRLPVLMLAAGVVILGLLPMLANSLTQPASTAILKLAGG